MTAFARSSESFLFALRVAFGAGVALDGELLDLRVLLDDLGDVVEEREALGLDRSPC